MKKNNINHRNDEFVNQVNVDAFRFAQFTKNKKKFLAVVAGICVLLIGVTALFSILDRQNKKVYYEVLNQSFAVKEEYDDSNKTYLAAILKKEFTTEQLTAVAEKFYSYTIYINGKALKPDDQVLYINEQVITIKIVETAEESPLPDDILALGAEEDVTQVINLLYAGEAPVITRDAQTQLSITQWVFNNMKVGSTITLVIPTDFLEKTGTNERLVEIVRNK